MFCKGEEMYRLQKLLEFRKQLRAGSLVLAVPLGRKLNRESGIAWGKERRWNLSDNDLYYISVDSQEWCFVCTTNPSSTEPRAWAFKHNLYPPDWSVKEALSIEM